MLKSSFLKPTNEQRARKIIDGIPYTLEIILDKIEAMSRQGRHQCIYENLSAQQITELEKLGFIVNMGWDRATWSYFIEW